MISLISLIFYVLQRLIQVYILAIVVYALLSWFPGAYQTGLGRLLARIVEPFQSWFNWAHLGMIGFAPLVAILVLTGVQYGLQYVQILLLNLLY
ncbi:YggT family protein [Secundilactobacillus kimchicus]|uniref:Cell division membrane protein n=1 Tax=Secundilactobacillus kimchicus JCM 15530 TaxID=1302272 RepID=A0A0R1HRV0_9LACO|nr:YggT family protein [Secundilactobacillus kimchicus]KRK49541.1 hypothetical protein FC96_GL000473 [Secundilactobacillus kimchicus JCM 15530]